MQSNSIIKEKYNRWIGRVFCWLLFTCNGAANAQQDVIQYPLIPYPANLASGQGHFIVTPATVILVPADHLFKNEAGILSELFAPGFGRPLKQSTNTKGSAIRLIYDTSVTAPEGYHLSITNRQVTLSAKSPAGMFMAIQTIRQLLPASVEKKNGPLQKSFSLPAVTIKDEPAYAWRGMHLDVSRHFFSVAYLKKLIDLMALYKFNKLHLHLTDDQGWRIEIKKYPRLTEEGAWRTFNKQDSACMERSKDNPDFIIDASHIIHKNGKILYGGYYTQQEMKEVVAYAAARHIDIIPEIDMPGHMMAAINAYNYLSCNGKSAFGELFSIPVCPCLPTTFEFAKDVFTEIMDIFPGQYIHIGGDEVDRSFWAKSDECKALMAKEGLKTTAELQSYFIRKMEEFFREKGRTLIGWDEILEGGISKTAVIMYWRTWVPKAPVMAAKNGNKVIMTPGNPLYFNEQPDKNSLPAVYHYDPVPAGLTEDEAKNITGAQANLWSEQIPSEKRADYMIMPRMTALAERLWTHRNDYKFYLQRLMVHYTRLDLLQVNYRLPDLPLLENYAFTDKDTLSIEKPLHNLTIRYTQDNTQPDTRSSVLTEPLVISQSQTIRLAAFRANGERGDVYSLHYRKESLAEAEPVAAANAGLICNWYKQFFKNTTLIPNDKPDGFANVPGIIVPKEAEAPSFALQYRGYINVPEDGIYSFYLTSDDGAVLRIAGREVVNNDGMHAPREKNGQVALKKGLHSIALDFIEGGGGYTLKLQYSKNGSEPQEIPAEWFKNYCCPANGAKAR
ncbi:MAG: family 20 glycosylhydrolase [Bacteroidota bacterium]|nr:family 20 glycosylhydrolase [Bacteroidota bacterium]